MWLLTHTRPDISRAVREQWLDAVLHQGMYAGIQQLSACWALQKGRGGGISCQTWEYCMGGLSAQAFVASGDASKADDLRSVSGGDNHVWRWMHSIIISEGRITSRFLQRKQITW